MEVGTLWATELAPDCPFGSAVCNPIKSSTEHSPFFSNDQPTHAGPIGAWSLQISAYRDDEDQSITVGMVLRTAGADNNR